MGKHDRLVGKAMAVGIDALTLIDPTVFEHRTVDYLQQLAQQWITRALQELYARGDWIVVNGRPVRHDQIRFRVDIEEDCVNIAFWEHRPLTAEQVKNSTRPKMPIAPPYSQRNEVTW